MNSAKSLKALEDSGFVSRETSERLDHFADLVRKWQKSINLVAPSTIDSLEERHLLDSLQLHLLTPQPKTWLDMGSGAGFPGIVTGICLAAVGEGWVHLVESNNKKAAFLRTAIAETGARASVHPLRVAEVKEKVRQIQAISARALAPLDVLLAMAHPFVQSNDNLQCWFHKGLDYRQEVETARGNWSFDLIEHASRVLEGSVILQIQRIQPR